eukprot:scaffold77964_cov14-Tisochrysis_lutea.AAC.1
MHPSCATTSWVTGTTLPTVRCAPVLESREYKVGCFGASRGKLAKGWPVRRCFYPMRHPWWQLPLPGLQQQQ